MDDGIEYYTLKGYSLFENSGITAAMEDYLEMILRLSKQQGGVRIRQLAEMLNVRPSSASKMVVHLKDKGLVHFQRYGQIHPTPAGAELGEYLLLRHNVLNRFLCLINHSEQEVEQVEKIEHFLNRRTVMNLKQFLEGLEGREGPDQGEKPVCGDTGL